MLHITVVSISFLLLQYTFQLQAQQTYQSRQHDGYLQHHVLRACVRRAEKNVCTIIVLSTDYSCKYDLLIIIVNVIISFLFDCNT